MREFPNLNQDTPRNQGKSAELTDNMHWFYNEIITINPNAKEAESFINFKNGMNDFLRIIAKEDKIQWDARFFDVMFILSHEMDLGKTREWFYRFIALVQDVYETDQYSG